MNNKITLSLLGGALVSGSAFAGEVVAPVQECAPCFEGNIYAGYHSDYIWRGTKQGAPLMDAGIDLAKSAAGIDFAAGAWMGTFQDASADQSSELDLYIEASKDFGFARFTAGYINYRVDTNPGTKGDLSEVYLGLSKDLAYGLSSSLTYFWDAKMDDDSRGNNDGYAELSLDKSDLFVENVSLGLDFGFVTEGWEANHLTTSLAYDYALTETATLAPYLAYTFELDNADQTFSPTGDEQNRFHAGVALSVSF